MAAHARTHLLSLDRVAVRRIELYLAQALQVVFQVEVFLAAQAKVPAVVQPQPCKRSEHAPKHVYASFVRMLDGGTWMASTRDWIDC